MNGKLICVCSLLLVSFLESTSGAALGLGLGLDKEVKVADISLGDGSDSGSSTSPGEATQQETQAKPELSLDNTLQNVDVAQTLDQVDAESVVQKVDVDQTVQKIEPAEITVIETKPVAPAPAPEVPAPAPAPAPVPVPVPVPAPAPEVPAPAPEAPEFEPTEPVTESVTNAAPAFVCPDVDENLFPQYVGLFRDPENCSKFYHCSHGEALLKDCGAGTVFDPVLQVCNFPSAVDLTGCRL